MMGDGFREKIESAINYHSKESGSGTPDFLLAEFLTDCLAAFDKCVAARERWYSRPITGIAIADPTSAVQAADDPKHE